jgi:hypothetical protein
VMAHPEDLLQLVLGMSSQDMFRDVFAGAAEVRPEALSDWFDAQTVRFGGQDVLDAVRALVGNAARFDFQTASAQIPKLDLPDLKPFFKAMLHLNKRKVQEDGSGLSFLTPEPWLVSPAVARQYAGMVFDRAGGDAQKVLGVGHRLVDLAIAQARAATGSVTVLPASVIDFPIYAFRVNDRVTSQGGVVRAVTVAVERRPGGFALVRDWELILRLNRILSARDPRRFHVQAMSDPGAVQADLEGAKACVREGLAGLDLPFRVPDVSVTCVLLRGNPALPQPGGLEVPEGDE